ncbi:hypothetical protein [Roseateles paludis]|uniref:TonB C-terminal domain-containing protein n=1 Tax=Roseateles paludis TaxID=3145238 RepID=A0ABV0FZC8_9BURK
MRVWLCIAVGFLQSAVALLPAAWAQTETVVPTDAQALRCLIKPEKPPEFPEQHRLDRGSGGMRVLLKFSAPDKGPSVEVLYNSARQDMQDEVYSYLSKLRLPCLQASDGVVVAVQEFRFWNSDRDPEPMPPASSQEGQHSCVVVPRTDMEGPPSWYRADSTEHIIAAVTFVGDGAQPPQVKFLHSSAGQIFEKAVRDRLLTYRMPCRTGKESPYMLRQQFTYFPARGRSWTLKQERFGLVEFLKMTSNVLARPVDFDLKTMDCPFKVGYTIYGGNVPNEAYVLGRRNDPNVLGFVRWLEGLQLRYSSAEQANDFFGSELQIEVPCLHLKLTPKPPVAASAP